MASATKLWPWFGTAERAERDEPTGDAALVAAAKRDPAAFAALYQRYALPIYRYCLSRLADPDAAEDALSQTFSRAFSQLHQCRDDAFRSWLFAIAHNVVIDRHRARHPSAPLDVAAEIADQTPGPEQVAIAADERRYLTVLLEQLTDEQRQVVELRLAGLTGVEIAAALGRSHESVKKLQARALIKLRTLMTNPPDREG